MGIQEAIKDCPSCGIGIPEAADRCTSCQSALGRCEGCSQWIVVGTRCFDCGKSTKVRIKPGTKVVVAPAKVSFEGSALGLIAPLALRFVFAAGAVACGVLALAAADVKPVAEFLAKYIALPKIEWPALAGIAGGCLSAGVFAGHLVRRSRLRNTRFSGKPVDIRLNVGSTLLNVFITVVVMALTAGLGLPWIFARYRRSFYRSCVVGGGAGRNLDFGGAGEEVLGRFLLTLLLLPFALATAGFLLAPISWMWLTWDQRNLLVPDKNGQLRRVRFAGTFGGYFGRFVVGWALTLVTAGLYRPWAKAAEWRWVADHTEIA